MGIRRSRYRGLAPTRLQHVAMAAAINLTRIADWLSGKRPKTAHCSPFASLDAMLTSPTNSRFVRKYPARIGALEVEQRSQALEESILWLTPEHGLREAEEP